MVMVPAARCSWVALPAGENQPEYFEVRGTYQGAGGGLFQLLGQWPDVDDVAGGGVGHGHESGSLQGDGPIMREAPVQPAPDCWQAVSMRDRAAGLAGFQRPGTAARSSNGT